jgi:hypothetical protein
MVVVAGVSRYNTRRAPIAPIGKKYRMVAMVTMSQQGGLSAEQANFDALSRQCMHGPRGPRPDDVNWRE